jgi:hypothetical protein
VRFQRLTSIRCFWEALPPVLGVTLVAYLFDLALGLRISYLGTTDEKTREIVLRVFWPDILLIQLKILVILFSTAALLWLWARLGLGLSRFESAVSAFVFWVMLMLRHARVWPAPYADIRDIRPIPDSVFVGMIEGRLGLFCIGVCAAFIGLILVRRILRDRAGSSDGASARFLFLRRIAAVAVAVAVFIAAGLTPRLPEWTRRPASDPRRPDVLLLMADSWRADHFECNAGSTLTPRLGRLCERQGGRFYTAYPSQPRTFGSITSLFTGIENDRTGIDHMMVRPEKRNIRHLSLVNEFHRLGYDSLAVSGLAGDVFPRVDLAFDRVVAPKFGFSAIVGEFSLRWHPLILPLLSTNRLGREIIEPRFAIFGDIGDPVFEAGEAVRLANGADARPLLLTVFLSGTHFPYAGRDGAAWRRGDDPVAARYRWYPTPYEAGRVAPALYPAIRNRYADKVQHVDEVLGEIAERALASGNTIVVVASDHGENLYEMHEGSHGDHVFGNQQLATPLLILDGRAGVAHVPEPVSDDAAPALYALPDVLPAVLRAIKDGTEIVLPRRELLHVQSDIIIQQFNVPLLDGRRLPYPELMDLLELDYGVGDMVVRKEWERVVEVGKFRALLTPQWAFVYSPGCREPRMTMYPREATDKASPEHSVDKEHPAEIEKAWALMQERWGKDLVRRETCGLEGL